MALPKLDRWSGAEYLAFERESVDAKHELINGEIVAMVGASRAHNIITHNVSVQFGIQLRERDCEVYAADMRVQVEADATYTYPDVVVVCGEPQLLDKHFDTLLNPTVLVEVLSPSTELKDRRQKLAQYKAIASLQDYLLVSQDTPRIERYKRQGSGWWYEDVVGLDGALKIASVDCELAMSEVYRKVVFGEDD